MHRGPARVVRDDEEHRQMHRLGHVMAGGGIAEHVGAVAERADHGLVRRGELGSERGAQTPAEPARRGIAEVAAGLLDRHLLEHRRIFVDQDGALVDQLVDARREPLAGDGLGHRLDAAARLGPDLSG